MGQLTEVGGWMLKEDLLEKIKSYKFDIGDQVRYEECEGVIVGYDSRTDVAPYCIEFSDKHPNSIIHSSCYLVNKKGEDIPTKERIFCWANESSLELIPEKKKDVFQNKDIEEPYPPKIIHPDAKFRPGMRVYSTEYETECEVIAFSDFKTCANVWVRGNTSKGLAHSSINIPCFGNHGERIYAKKLSQDEYFVQCQHNLREIERRPGEIYISGTSEGYIEKSLWEAAPQRSETFFIPKEEDTLITILPPPEKPVLIDLDLF